MQNNIPTARRVVGTGTHRRVEGLHSGPESNTPVTRTAEAQGSPLNASATVTAAQIALTPNHPIPTSTRFNYAAGPLEHGQRVYIGTEHDGIVTDYAGDCEVRVDGRVVYANVWLSHCERWAARHGYIFSIPAAYHSTAPQPEPEPKPPVNAMVPVDSSYLLVNAELGHVGEVESAMPFDNGDVPEPPTEEEKERAAYNKAIGAFWVTAFSLGCPRKEQSVDKHSDARHEAISCYMGRPVKHMWELTAREVRSCVEGLREGYIAHWWESEKMEKAA